MTRLPRSVLHVMNGTGGGAPLSTLSTIRVMAQLGIESSVICHDQGTAGERARIREAVEGRAIFAPLYWWNQKIRAAEWKRPLIEARQLLLTGGGVGSTARVVEAAHRFGVELIHTNTLLTPEGGRAAQLLGLPHVWHLREMIGPDQPFRLSRSLDKLGQYLSSHASMVVANSAASARPLRAHLAPDRLAVVWNGVDLSVLCHLERAPQHALVFAMVGNLSSRMKKHGLFIEAARRVKGAEFRLYGDAPERDAHVEALKAQAAGAGVRMMGFVAPEQLFGEIDVLVHTADGESFGRTVVEAMAAGLPVVGVADGGLLETVVHEETGLLGPADDVQALANHLERLVRDAPLRLRLGAAGRARAVALFSLEAHQQRIADVYRVAMARPLGSTWRAVPLAAQAAWQRVVR